MKRMFRTAVLSAMLFSLLPLQARAAELLIPVGRIVGLQLKNDCVTVVAYDDACSQPAKEAGLKIGDRLISVDDVLVNAGTDVTDYLATKNVGDVVQVSVERSRQLVRVNVTLVENGTPAA